MDYKDTYSRRKKFLRYSSKPKINQKTLRNAFENGGLKNVDAKSKITSLQCSSVKKLHDGNHHDWKVVPLYFIDKYFGKNFHSNLSFNLVLVDSFPEFYKQIFINWSKSWNKSLLLCFQFRSSIHFLWYNKYILIDNKSAYLSSFSDKDVNCINNFFNELF